MKAMICSTCGASRWRVDGNYRRCLYCGTEYEIDTSLQPRMYPSVYSTLAEHTTDTDISLKEDVEKLLEKCKMDPANAFKYANLVLDIDPTNSQALYIVYGGKRRR